MFFLGNFWVFAVKITECVFSLKSLGLLTPTYPSPKKNRFFLTPSLIVIYEDGGGGCK